MYFIPILDFPYPQKLAHPLKPMGYYCAQIFTISKKIHQGRIRNFPRDPKPDFFLIKIGEMGNKSKDKAPNMHPSKL